MFLTAFSVTFSTVSSFCISLLVLELANRQTMSK